MRGDYDIEQFGSAVSAAAKAVVRGLLLVEPGARLTAAQCLHTPWLQDTEGQQVGRWSCQRHFTIGERRRIYLTVPEGAAAGDCGDAAVAGEAALAAGGPPGAGHPQVLYCTVLYCTVLHCTVLYCTALRIQRLRGGGAGDQQGPGFLSSLEEVWI